MHNVVLYVEVVHNVALKNPDRQTDTIAAVCMYFQNVSFTVDTGEVVALAGPSGGGKTSCINLIQRFYQPTSGTILLDGIPIECYDTEFYHDQVTP